MGTYSILKLLCFETMNQVDICEYRTLIRNLYQEDLPFCLVSPRMSQWLRLSYYFRKHQLETRLVDLIVPYKMKVRYLKYMANLTNEPGPGLKKYSNGNYCTVCCTTEQHVGRFVSFLIDDEEEKIIEGDEGDDGTYPIDKNRKPTFNCFMFFLNQLNFCKQCECPLFIVIDEYYNVN